MRQDRSPEHGHGEQKQLVFHSSHLLSFFLSLCNYKLTLSQRHTAPIYWGCGRAAFGVGRKFSITHTSLLALPAAKAMW